MAGALRFQGFAQAGSFTPYAVFAFDAQIAYATTPGAEELALEYDIKIKSMPGPLNQLGFVDFVDNTGSHFYYQPDQERRAAFSIGDVNELVTRASDNWYRRVVRLPQTISSRTYSQWRIGLWANFSGSTYPGAIDYEITNIRLTKFRETVFWFWRDGMATPVFVSSNDIGASFFGGVPSVTTGVVAAPELPTYCSVSTQETLDDVSHQRRAGGRLNSWLFWDETKDSFTLSNIRLTEEERWSLETFYAVFRRDSFIYRHRANLPGMWCRFAKPPTYRDVIENGKVVYETTITLLRR